MEILYLLIPLSVVLVFLIGGIFWWSVKSGQFDDLEGPAHRILQDEDKPPLPGPLLASPQPSPVNGEGAHQEREQQIILGITAG